MDKNRTELDRLLSQNKKLRGLLNVSESIMSEMHLDVLLQKIMEEVTKVMDADRSTLFLLDTKTNELWSKIAQGENIGEIRFPSNAGIAGHVATTGETINIQDAYKDLRFNQDIDKKTGFRTKSILTMALRNSSKGILGVMQVLNKKGHLDFFTESDEDLLRAFSSIAAISLENAIVYEQVHKTMKTFELFVPRKFLYRIAEAGLDSIKLGSAREEVVSVLFSDIRKFTSLSETMTADETLKFLNSYIAHMGKVISNFDGFIDKFIGDAIMAIFDQKTADNCVQAAMAMREKLEEYNTFRKSSGYVPIDIGIGINTGSAIIGTIGTIERMDSTVIGDSVNLASRLEGVTKMYNTPVLVSEDTLHHLEDKSNYYFREVDSVIVKGRSSPTTIYELFNYNTPEVKELKFKSNTFLTEGKKYYKARQWDRAVSQFIKALDVLPTDKIAHTFIQRCETYKKIPPPHDWDGSFKLDEK